MRGRQVVQGDEVEEFWALKDVSFEVKRARSSASSAATAPARSRCSRSCRRITEPTAGRVTLRGRVASLLEVGTGFHPELTGRENIYLNGAILGMTRAEIRKKFDEIVAFAEVEKFLDTPVKRYSSGMYVRLAFAVAAHLEPEILIVDEVLAVGDAEFQKKCLGKMDDVSRRDGRTVLFVSHNMGAVTTLCATALWLEGGAVRERGATREVIGKYLSRRKSDWEQFKPLADIPRNQWLKDDRLRFRSIEWLSELPLRHGEPARARISLTTRAPVSEVTVAIGFSIPDGPRLLTYETDFQQDFPPRHFDARRLLARCVDRHAAAGSRHLQSGYRRPVGRQSWPGFSSGLCSVGSHQRSQDTRISRTERRSGKARQRLVLAIHRSKG